MPVTRTRGIPAPTVAHEGNPRSTSLVVSGTLDGEAFIHFLPPDTVTFAAPPPSEEASSNSNCPNCTTLDPSIVSQAGIDLCASSAGDGIVTLPGDYDSDPTFWAEACANYYGAFRFGLNSTYYGDFPAPAWYTTTPTLWLPPKGYISVNSSCGTSGLVTRRLVFDNRVSGNSIATTNFTGLTPATVQSAMIDVYNTAQGVDPDGTTLGALVQPGLFDCRYPLRSSGANYYSQVSGTYMSELHNPISGVAMLTDDGTGSTITGFGLFVNRQTFTLDTVAWSDDIAGNYTILNSTPYEPVQGDLLTVEIYQKCPCPFGSQDPSSIHPAYPKGGFLKTYLFGVHDPSASKIFTTDVPVFADQVGSINPATYESLGYGALIVVPNLNGFCNNIAVWRELYVRYVQALIVTC